MYLQVIHLQCDFYQRLEALYPTHYASYFFLFESPHQRLFCNLQSSSIRHVTLQQLKGLLELIEWAILYCESSDRSVPRRRWVSLFEPESQRCEEIVQV